MVSVAGAITILAGAVPCVGGMHTDLYATQKVAYLAGGVLIVLGLIVLIWGLFSARKTTR
jgi:hypothetical protein